MRSSPEKYKLVKGKVSQCMKVRKQTMAKTQQKRDLDLSVILNGSFASPSKATNESTMSVIPTSARKKSHMVSAGNSRLEEKKP